VSSGFERRPCPARGHPNCSCSGQRQRQAMQADHRTNITGAATPLIQLKLQQPRPASQHLDRLYQRSRIQSYDTTKRPPPGSSSASPSHAVLRRTVGLAVFRQTVTAMSNQWQTLKGPDQTPMSPSGNTNQAVGSRMGDGSRWIRPNPAYQGAGENQRTTSTRTISSLLSDGLNTQKPLGVRPQSTIDARQQILCQNVKADTSNPVHYIHNSRSTSAMQDARIAGCCRIARAKATSR